MKKNIYKKAQSCSTKENTKGHRKKVVTIKIKRAINMNKNKTEVLLTFTITTHDMKNISTLYNEAIFSIEITIESLE